MMSGNGRLRALLEAKRREELRKNRVRNQCTNLLNVLEKRLTQYVSNPATSHFIGEEATEIRNQWKKANLLLQTNPDDALLIVQESAEEVNNAITSTIAKKKEWTTERQTSEQLLNTTVDNLETLSIQDTKLHEKRLILVQRLKTMQNTASTAELIRKGIDKVTTEINHLLSEDEELEVRKEIVKAILSALKKQGFIVSTPSLKQKVVHVTGKMPSGKMALFQIYDDRTINFDLEGYTGTTCKQELNGVLEKINSEGNIETSIEQFIWHNPDKIRKGSKEFPTAVGQTRTMKK
ncbi:MAG: hypothetical protein ACFE9L_00115 [Candidatus Hodarchaeota archaeon]